MSDKNTFLKLLVNGLWLLTAGLWLFAIICAQLLAQKKLLKWLQNVCKKQIYKYIYI